MFSETPSGEIVLHGLVSLKNWHLAPCKPNTFIFNPFFRSFRHYIGLTNNYSEWTFATYKYLTITMSHCIPLYFTSRVIVKIDKVHQCANIPWRIECLQDVVHRVAQCSTPAHILTCMTCDMWHWSLESWFRESLSHDVTISGLVLNNFLMKDLNIYELYWKYISQYTPNRLLALIVNYFDEHTRVIWPNLLWM